MMQAKQIFGFLKDIAANNNRPWFLSHRDEYLACRAAFEQAVDQFIAALSAFDAGIIHLTGKECCFRFYRDTRFSPDKAPYKRHFSAYVCAHGKKALRGGYYLHMQPGMSVIATGAYTLPTNILTSCRNEIMGNIDEWRRAVESKAFVEYFGRPNEGHWTRGDLSSKGFGMEALKSVPKGFPRDYEHLNYLRMKDYVAWRTVPDSCFETDEWLDDSLKHIKAAKPMMDIINAVIDDYE